MAGFVLGLRKGIDSGKKERNTRTVAVNLPAGESIWRSSVIFLICRNRSKDCAVRLVSSAAAWQGVTRADYQWEQWAGESRTIS